jgi:hypothetical protein
LLHNYFFGYRILASKRPLRSAALLVKESRAKKLFSLQAKRQSRATAFLKTAWPFYCRTGATKNRANSVTQTKNGVSIL